MKFPSKRFIPKSTILPVCALQKDAAARHVGIGVEKTAASASSIATLSESDICLLLSAIATGPFLVKFLHLDRISYLNKFRKVSGGVQR